MAQRCSIPFGTIVITDEAKTLIAKALETACVSSGAYVRAFEEQFARITGVNEAVAVSTGTDADTLALAVLYDFGAQRGDEVIVPALSFAATGHAVLHAGFIPVFVDIKRDTLNIDEDKIEAAITRKTRAIMPVHLMGKPAKMDVINAIAKKHNLFVIEDAAEAHGAQYKGKNVGLWSDMAAYSTYVAHIVTTIEGGVVTANRADYAEIVRSLRAHGRACKCNVCLVNTQSGHCERRFSAGKDRRFIFERIGYSAKMNELEAAVGLGSLKLYDEVITKRRHNLLSMIEQLKQFELYLTTITEEKDEKIGPHAFPIILTEKAPFTRDEFTGYLEKHAIDSRDLFSSMPTQCPGFAFLGHAYGEFPNAEFIGTHGLHVGVHQGLTDEHIGYLTDAIKEFIRRY